MIACNTAERKNIMQYDHNSEIIRFFVPRYIEGHDMLNCNSVHIHYTNLSANKRDYSCDIYEVLDLAEYEGDVEYLICSWVIDSNATKYAGQLLFDLTFRCVNGEDVDYIWSATSNPGITVLPCKNHSAAIADKYSDILTSMESRLAHAENEISILSEAIASMQYST